MNSKIQVGLIFLACFLAFAGCSEEEQSQENPPPSPILEPLVGLDTTPLITLAQEAKMAGMVLIPYKENGLWGYADTSGAVVVPPKYETAEPFLVGSLTVVKTGTGYGLLNKLGEEVVKPLQPHPIVDCGCGIYGFQQTKGFALVNKLGKRIDQGRFEKIWYDCEDDRLAVKQDGKWGFIDSQGNTKIAADLEHFFPFYHGVAPVRKLGQEKWMVIDRNGKSVTSERFETLYPFTNGFGVGIQTDPTGKSKYGVIDTAGNVVIPFQFARISGTFTGDYVACAAYDPYELESKGISEEANTWFIYDRKGKKVGETHYVLWDEFSEGLIVAQKGEKFGFVDSTGQMAIPFEYEWACAFKNGLAWVRKNERYGFIDKRGKVVIPLQYDSAYDYVFMEDHGAPVVDPRTQERFYVDRHGKEHRKKP